MVIDWVRGIYVYDQKNTPAHANKYMSTNLSSSCCEIACFFCIKMM